MKYVNLGRSGLKVSRLCLGCMSYGEPERLPSTLVPWMKRRHDRSFVRRLKPALIFLIPRISTRAVVQKKLQEKR